MVMQDAVTAWDLKPNRENTNKIFNVLCNVQPVEHPWSGDWYARKIDVTTWSKDQFWFEKCKWLKKCKLYEYECSWDCVKLVVPEDHIDPGDEQAASKKRRNEKLWHNANFTDVILFQWYRIYMRKNTVIVNPYWTRAKENEYWKQYVDSWWDWNKNTCWPNTDTKPSAKLEDLSVDRTIINRKRDSESVNTFNTAWRIRIYIQQVDSKTCTWDTFDSPDESPIILVKEYEAAECNPDHFIMWYGWIWTPYIIDDATVAAILYQWKPFAYLKNDKDKTLPPIAPTDSIYLQKYWITITWLQTPDNKMEWILWELWLESWWYMIPMPWEMASVWLIFPEDTTEWEWWDFKDNNVWRMLLYTEYWEIPYFAAWNNLISINWFYTLKDNDCYIPDDDELNDEVFREWTIVEDVTACKATDVDCTRRRIFLFDNVIDAATNEDVITWFTRWWARIAYVAWWNLYVSWNWIMNWVFWTDMTVVPVWQQDTRDLVRWSKILPAWITDVKTYWWSLLFFWPKSIYGTASERTLVSWVFVNWTDNEDWYYSPWSYHNDDWVFLLARRWKVLWSLQVQISYNDAMSVWFDPEVWYYAYSHLRSLNNETDKINIDANINYRYVSIYDDNDAYDYDKNISWHYSKLLIYDKHYKCRYRWMITWARIVHVKDNIFLWDWVYANKWRTWWWKKDDTEWWEIIEIISAYVWEEWLQTPKHIQYVKTAIWDHSVISNNSLWDIDTSYWWRLYRRRNNITSARYPNLLSKKTREDSIETYEIGEEIYWHWKLLSHNLLNEISEYRNYDKFSNTIIREMWEESDMISELAMFASIKEPINAPANVLELCISARHLDNVQFGSFYIWYYQLDADYEDIANTNIDISDASDLTEESETVINKWEYCEEILDGSACDVPPAGSF